MEYEVDGEVIPMVSSYKYLGRVVDEHLELKERCMEEKAACWGEEGTKCLAEQV